MNRPYPTLAVIGAGGRSGQEFVSAALNAGFCVRAGIHRHNPFDVQQNLIVISIDSTNKANLRKLLSSSQIVISLIGHGSKSPADLQAKTIESLIELAPELGIERIISLTGTGVRYPGDKISLVDRLLNWTIALVDPKRINDGIEHARLLEQSAIPYSLFRVLKLTNAKEQPYSLTSGGPAKIFVSRSTLAQAVIDSIRQNNYEFKAPVISSQRKHLP